MVPAVCTQCGGKILVDDSHDAGICEYCGTPFVTEKVINNYNNSFNIKSATININTEESIDRTVIISWRYTQKQYISKFHYYLTDGRVCVDDSVYASLEEGATASFKIDSLKSHRIYVKFKYVATEDYSLKIDRTEEKISNVIQVQSSNTPLFLSVESLEFSELKLQEEKTDPTNTVGKQQKQSCYIATAIYGSYDCPEVWTLRRYRDYTLAETWYGRAFICAYYAISPTIVKWFGKTVFFTCFWRFALDKMIKRLNTMGVVNTPYEDRNW